MSGADYIHCANGCNDGSKLIYTGDRYWGEEPPKVYCEKCYLKLNKKLEKLKRRKR